MELKIFPQLPFKLIVILNLLQELEIAILVVMLIQLSILLNQQLLQLSHQSGYEVDLYAIVDVGVIKHSENLDFLHNSLEFLTTFDRGIEQFISPNSVNLIHALTHLIRNIPSQYGLFLPKDLDHLRIMQGSFNIFILSD